MGSVTSLISLAPWWLNPLVKKCFNFWLNLLVEVPPSCIRPNEFVGNFVSVARLWTCVQKRFIVTSGQLTLIFSTKRMCNALTLNSKFLKANDVILSLFSRYQSKNGWFHWQNWMDVFDNVNLVRKKLEFDFLLNLRSKIKWHAQPKLTQYNDFYRIMPKRYLKSK